MRARTQSGLPPTASGTSTTSEPAVDWPHSGIGPMRTASDAPTSQVRTQSLRGVLDVGPRKRRVKHELARQIAMKDPRIDVEPDSRSLNDRVAEVRLGVRFDEMTEKPQRGKETARLLSLVGQRFGGGEISLDNRPRQFGPCALVVHRFDISFGACEPRRAPRPDERGRRVEGETPGTARRNRPAVRDDHPLTLPAATGARPATPRSSAPGRWWSRGTRAAAWSRELRLPGRNAFVPSRAAARAKMKASEALFGEPDIPPCPLS